MGSLRPLTIALNFLKVNKKSNPTLIMIRFHNSIYFNKKYSHFIQYVDFLNLIYCLKHLHYWFIAAAYFSIKLSKSEQKELPNSDKNDSYYCDND